MSCHINVTSSNYSTHDAAYAYVGELWSWHHTGWQIRYFFIYLTWFYPTVNSFWHTRLSAVIVSTNHLKGQQLISFLHTLSLNSSLFIYFSLRLQIPRVCYMDSSAVDSLIIFGISVLRLTDNLNSLHYPAFLKLLWNFLNLLTLKLRQVHWKLETVFSFSVDVSCYIFICCHRWIMHRGRRLRGNIHVRKIWV